MTSRTTWSVGFAALLLMMAPGATADDGEQDPITDTIGHVHDVAQDGQDDLEDVGKASNGAAQACRPFSWEGGRPAVSINPVLGLIMLDPDGCIGNIAAVAETALNAFP